MSERYVLMKCDPEGRYYGALKLPEGVNGSAEPMACVGRGVAAVEVVRVTGSTEHGATLLARYLAGKLQKGSVNRSHLNDDGLPEVYEVYSVAERVARDVYQVTRPPLGYDEWGVRIVDNTEGGK